MVQTWRHSHLVQSDELKVTNFWWRKNNLAADDDINKLKKLSVHVHMHAKWAQPALNYTFCH